MNIAPENTPLLRNPHQPSQVPLSAHIDYYLQETLWRLRYVLRAVSIFARPLVALGSTWFVAAGFFIALSSRFHISIPGIVTDDAGNTSLERGSFLDIATLLVAGAPSFVVYMLTRSSAVFDSLKLRDKTIYEKIIGADQNDTICNLVSKIFCYGKTNVSNQISFELSLAIFFVRVMNAISSALGTMKIIAEFQRENPTSPIFCAYSFLTTLAVGLVGALIAYYPFEDFMINKVFKRHYFIMKILEKKKLTEYLPSQTGFSNFRYFLIKAAMEITYFYSVSSLILDLFICNGQSGSTMHVVSTLIPMACMYLGFTITHWGRVAGDKLKKAATNKEVNDVIKAYDFKMNLAKEIAKAYQERVISAAGYNALVNSKIFHSETAYSNIEALKNAVSELALDQIDKDKLEELVNKEPDTLESLHRMTACHKGLSYLLMFPGMLSVVLDTIQINLSTITTTWYFLSSLLSLPGYYSSTWQDMLSDTRVSLATNITFMMVGMLLIANMLEASLTVGPMQAAKVVKEKVLGLSFFKHKPSMVSSIGINGGGISSTTGYNSAMAGCTTV
jgi:hypothetical protein